VFPGTSTPIKFIWSKLFSFASITNTIVGWLSGIKSIDIVSHKDTDIVKKYGEILSYVQACGFYKPKALAEWSNAKVADAWIVACANVQSHTVVTFEEPNGNLTKSSPCSRAKIPEICDVFDVEYTNLFEMMRQLSFTAM